MLFIKKSSILLLLVWFCSSSFWALEPPTKAELEQYAKDGSLYKRILNAYALGNHLLAPELAQNLRTRFERFRPAGIDIPKFEIEMPAGLPPGIRNTLKSKGTVKVFALLISFSDYPAYGTSASIDAKIFGDGDGNWPYESLCNYYRRASYNMLEIKGVTLGWYTPAYPRSSLAQTTAARENLIKEALTYFDNQGHDFSQYDNDGNGAIDYFLVIWTGPNNGWANFWWGYQTTFSDQNFKLDGKSFYQTRYSWQWECRSYPGPFTASTVIHETGHALGLPDYYDYDDTVGPRGGVGGLDMMDASRGDHNAFSKMLLDWITPQFFSYGNRAFVLGASGNTRDALIVMPEFSSSKPLDEFFIVQNRFRAENDFFLPGDGLLIWHVDARLNSSNNFLYDNSYTEHKLLRLMEADGQEQIEKNYAATAADYYVQGNEFRPTAFPNSRRYDATDSGVSVYGIGPSGQSMTLTADIHYTLLPPLNPAIQRLESDFIFFKEYINKLTWQNDPKNRTEIDGHRIYKKSRGAPDAAFVLESEVGLGILSYEHKGLKKDEFFVYRIIAVDKNGVESSAVEVSN
jgi:M6 family metalloprotease-like protein